MTIDKEIEADILRLHFVERWGVHTIARQLHVHHSAVERVLSQAGCTARRQRPRKPCMIDPYEPFILETLAQYPNLSGTRLYQMCVQRGYPGAPSQFRARLALIRPRKPAKAYLRLSTLPGEQMQCDWMQGGWMTIGRAQRPVMGFVMVLAYSRRIFLRFYLSQRMSCFVHGHVSAFQAWQGLARTCLYDNLKSAVLERRGAAIRFNPTLLELAAHYRFKPQPVNVRAGNEKGRAERAIRYIRTNFLAGRQWRDLDDLNEQAHQWCQGSALDRPWPQDRGISVREAFEQERQSLLACPPTPFNSDEQCTVTAGKTPYVRYDLNDYSIPHTHVRRTLTVFASQHSVRIVDAGKQIAQHKRHYGKGEQIEDVQHIQALREYKRASRAHSGQSRLTAAAPGAEAFLKAAATHGYVLASTARALEAMLDDYGAAELEAAMQEVLARTAPHPNAVRITLERRREARDLPPPLSLGLAGNDRARDILVKPASLADYDRINVGTDNTDNTDNNDAPENTP